MDADHVSVLLKEAVDFLNVQKEGLYLDATLGGGGHSLEILRRGGRVLAFDIDREALRVAEKRLLGFTGFRFVKANFTEMVSVALRLGYRKFDGLIFDLGLSRYQLNSGRGFSYQSLNEPLDMRSDPETKTQAASLLNDLSSQKLYEIFIKFGEERISQSLADLIVLRRKVRPIRSVGDLREIVRLAVGGKEPPEGTLARVFQALRIYVNSEIGNLKKILPETLYLLGSGGRLVVISYHSLEDRVVKSFFQREAVRGRLTILTKRPVHPSPMEVRANPSARSAKLRAAVKTYD